MPTQEDVEEAQPRKGTRTRKSDRTRERIVTAASDLIRERGGADFQMSEVASRCGMSNGSLYYYFPDREAIVEEIMGRGIDRVVGALEGAISDARSAHDALDRVCVEYGGNILDGGSVVVSLASEMVQGGSNAIAKMESRFDRIEHLVEVQIERAKTEGVVREGLDSRLAASCVCGTFFFAAIERMADDGENFDASRFSADLMDFISHGLGAA